MAWDLGDTVPLTIVVTDGDDEQVDAASVVLGITGPAGVVPGTIPQRADVGVYAFDFVPTVPGLYRVRWASSGPATAFDDVVDVRPSIGTVVSLVDAKLYLNKQQIVHVDDDELREMMPAAVARVDRHLWTKTERAAGHSLTALPAVSAEQAMAVKMVLAEYWRPQRVKWSGSGMGGGASGTAIQQDSGPGGMAPLEVRLTDLLGPAAEDEGLVPTGSFPPAQPWPDPAAVYPYWRTSW